MPIDFPKIEKIKNPSTDPSQMDVSMKVYFFLVFKNGWNYVCDRDGWVRRHSRVQVHLMGSRGFLLVC